MISTRATIGQIGGGQSHSKTLARCRSRLEMPTGFGVRLSSAAFDASRFTHHSPAFTLMEMLLALAVSAIVVAAIGGVFYSALRLRERTAAAVDQAAPLRQALAVIRRDLQGVLPPSGLLAGGNT